MSNDMSKLEFGKLAEADFEWLSEAIAQSGIGLDPQHIMLDLATGSAEVWRIGDFSGILITKAVQRPAGSQLVLVAMAGETAQRSQIQKAATAHGCNKIIGIASTEMEQEQFAALGMEPTHQYFEMPVNKEDTDEST